MTLVESLQILLIGSVARDAISVLNDRPAVRNSPAEKFSTQRESFESIEVVQFEISFSLNF